MAEEKPSDTELIFQRASKKGDSEAVSPTSEIEMAEEAARYALDKLHAYLSGKSSDYKGARAALKTLNRHTDLLRAQNAARRAALGAALTIKRLTRQKRRGA